MSSSQALSSGPQWQIDIPTLAQVITNLGFAGLKQLALAGIDVHSLVCLHALSGVTAASLEYRKVLERCKRKHLKTTWIQKALEIAGASNYFVGTLFKDGRGVNIVALLSTLIPFLDCTDFECVFLGIFADMHVPDDQVPGFGETAKIREALLPFTRACEFPSWVFSHHLWFTEKLDPTRKAEYTPRRYAIPEVARISQIINLFYQLTSSQERYILHVHGVPGAGWIAAYAVKVLGLQCCAIRATEELLPINSSYADAQVLFYFEASHARLDLYLEAKVEDHIVQDNSNPRILDWGINCDVVNFFKLQCPKIHSSRLLNSVSHFVAAKTVQAIYNFVTHQHRIRTRLFHCDTEPMPEGGIFLTYLEDALPDLQARSVAILENLGFHPREAMVYTSRVSSKEQRIAPVVDIDFSATEADVNEFFRPLFFDLGEDYNPNVEGEATSGAEQSLNVPVQQRKEASVVRILNHFHRTMGTLCKRYGCDEGLCADTNENDSLYYVLQNAIRIVSTLAFTNWTESYRTISTAFLEPRPSKRLRAGMGMARPPSRGEGWERLELLFEDAFLISTTLTHRDVQLKLSLGGPFNSDTWIAHDCDGVVVVRTLHCPPVNLPIRGCLLSFHLGHIVAHGESYPVVRTDYPNDRDEHLHREHRMDEGIQLLQPVDNYANCTLQGISMVRENSIWLRWEFHLNSAVAYSVNSSLIASQTYHGLYSKPCSHFPGTVFDLRRATEVFKPRVFEWFEGLVDSHTVEFHRDGRNAHMPPTVRFSLQQVKKNSLCQWVAANSHSWSTTWADSSDNPDALHFVHIFQRQTCLNCLVEPVKKMIDNHAHLSGIARRQSPPPQLWSVFVIPDMADINC